MSDSDSYALLQTERASARADAGLFPLTGRELAGELGRFVASKLPARWFFTGTFARPGETWSGYDAMGVARAEAAFEGWLADVGAKRYWAAMEFHKWRSTPHFHAAIAGMPTVHERRGLLVAGGESWCACDTARRVHLWAWCHWKRQHGRAQLDVVRSAEAVSAYVSKYVNKSAAKLWVSGL